MKAESQCLENTGFLQEHDFSCVLSKGRQLLIFCIVEHSSVLDSRYCLSGCQGDVSAGAAAGTQGMPVLCLITACAQGGPRSTPVGHTTPWVSCCISVQLPTGSGSSCRAGLPLQRAAILLWSCTKQLLSPSQAGRAMQAVME